jgi:glutamate-5-semialdehyde dehydrogenase
MVNEVKRLPDPTGKILLHTELDQGLELVQKTVPLGVVVVVFESRPDVIPQISSLILKSGNAVVLKGGREAAKTNAAFEKIWDQVASRLGFLPKGWLQQVGGREEFRSLLKHDEYIDLVIPRGSNKLVSTVMKQTRAPVLGHAEGICSLFIHEKAQIEKALEITIDAKLQSPSTCNAIETLLVQSSVAKEFLTLFRDVSEEAGLTLFACPKSRKFLPKAKVTLPKHFHTEFGDARLAVKTVDDLDAAIEHINTHGSHHTDGIVTEDPEAARAFCEGVDSASVMVNASTRFADGYRYGLGAEVGISTAKIHVRGPAGLDSLTTTKFFIMGQGQVVSDYVGPESRPFTYCSL